MPLFPRERFGEHRLPDTYIIQRVNMGDKPAPAISTEAVYKTVELFREDSPPAADVIKYSSYVDDLIDSRPSKPDALKIAKETKEILAKGRFSINSQVLAIQWRIKFAHL